MKRTITNIRRAVAVMANELRKTGLTLSEAFKKAWRRIKAKMTFRAVGVTYENRQEIIEWFAQFKDVKASLERDYNNKFDTNAIKIIFHAAGKRGCVGYVNKTLAESLASVLDKGVNVKTSARIIGGGCSLSYGALVTIEV